MGCYRDDLEAAKLRVEQLETELQDAEEELGRARRELQSRARETPPRRSYDGGAIGWAIFAAMMLAFSCASVAMWHVNRHAQHRTRELRKELDRARAEAMVAKQEARTAMEMIRQNADDVARARPDHASEQAAIAWQRRGDPLAAMEADDSVDVLTIANLPQTRSRGSSVERGTGPSVIWATSRPDARLKVDGRIHGYTPMMLRVEPGVHALTFIHDDLGVRTREVYLREGESLRTEVVFQHR